MKQAFLEVLREYEAHGGRGIIYGGALRDMMTDKGPIKDIDIAVRNTAEDKAAIALFSCPALVVVQHIGYGNFPDVIRSYQVDREDGGPTINFVMLDDSVRFDPLSVAGRCDFGLCQIAMASTGVVMWTEAFQKDLNDKTFTYLREPFDAHQFDRSRRRWDRLKQRYTDPWRMVVPGHRHLEPDFDPLPLNLDWFTL